MNTYAPSPAAIERYKRLVAHYQSTMTEPAFPNGAYNYSALDVRGQMIDDGLHRIMGTVAYDRVAAQVGGVERMSVREQNEWRLKLALEDGNLQAVTSNGSTVAEMVDSILSIG